MKKYVIIQTKNGKNYYRLEEYKGKISTSCDEKKNDSYYEIGVASSFDDALLIAKSDAISKDGAILKTEIK